VSSESLSSPFSADPVQPEPSATEPGPEAAPGTTRGGPPGSRGPARRDRLKNTARLTERDHKILGWLAEHYLLSTTQITRAAFTGPRRARKRLRELHDIEAVNRFVDVTTGSRQYLYALGPLGQVVNPTSYHHPDRPDAPAARTSIERTERIVGSRKLAHLLGTNQFFVDLIAAARTMEGAGLLRWWSEQHIAAAYSGFSSIQPDGHGIWRLGERTVGFWLEHDRGTESLGTVLDKLTAYARLADGGGPRYPVLLHVPSRAREEHLLDAFAHLRPSMPVATAVHADHPAGLAWTLAGDRSRQRRWLHELPSDHGHLDPVNNPHRFSEPGT
jgi:DNA-binding CsgD family transcriptional regulator